MEKHTKSHSNEAYRVMAALASNRKVLIEDRRSSEPKKVTSCCLVVTPFAVARLVWKRTLGILEGEERRRRRYGEDGDIQLGNEHMPCHRP